MLWEQVRNATARALACGAQQPIATRYEIVPDGGVDFIVRVVENIARKEHAKKREDVSSANPFLLYDPNLFVAELSATHVCLLNKYNVMDGHLLIVTRVFEEQESPITAADFGALWHGLAQIDGLGFYNAGACSGASQSHKHFQMVPLPLAPGIPRIPLEARMASAQYKGDIGFIPGLPFRHAIARLEPDVAGEQTARRYEALLRSLGQGYSNYNLLQTRRWMMAVPRTRERAEGISVNALGFAGTLLVRDAEQLATVKRVGPMAILRQVTSVIPA